MITSEEIKQVEQSKKPKQEFKQFPGKVISPKQKAGSTTKAKFKKLIYENDSDTSASDDGFENNCNSMTANTLFKEGD